MRWTGWVVFAGWVLIVIGFLDFFEGLIAVIRGRYYVLTPEQIIVFDVRTWGWLTLIWGIVVAFAALFVVSTFVPPPASERERAARYFSDYEIDTGLQYSFERKLLSWPGTFIELGLLIALRPSGQDLAHVRRAGEGLEAALTIKAFRELRFGHLRVAHEVE